MFEDAAVVIWFNFNAAYAFVRWSNKMLLEICIKIRFLLGSFFPGTKCGIFSYVK